MPKVSVITLPEEIIQPTPVRAPVDNSPVDKHGLIGGELLSWLKLGLTALFHRQNLALNLLALLVGRVSLLGEIAPFGLALFAATAAFSRQRAAAAGVWAATGVLSAGFYQEAVIYAFSMLLYWRMSDKLTKYQKKAHTIPLFMFASVFLSGLALLPWQEFTIYNAMLVSFNALLCMVLIYVFQYGVPLFLDDSKESQIAAENLICGVIILAAAVGGIGNVTVFDYSLRNIGGSLIAMTLAYSGGTGLGSSVGVVTGLIIGLSDGDAAPVIAMYAIAGMLAGLFKGMGKPAVLLGFMLGSAIAVLYLGQPGELLLNLIEVSAAGAAFMLVPASMLTNWRESYIEEHHEPGTSAQRVVNTAVDKLTNIAEIFDDLAGAFEAGSARERDAYQEQIRDKELAQMLSAVGEKVCGPCSLRNECWDKDFYHTYQSMLNMLSIAESRKLRPQAMPGQISGTCPNKGALAEIINQVVDNNKTNRYWQKKLSECREVAAEQIKATGAIIGNLALELKKSPQTDTEVAQQLTERSAVLGCRLSDAKVVGHRGKVVVEAYKKPCANTRECVNTILPLTANLLQEKMILHAECGNKLKHTNCLLKMELAERYQLETGMASMPKEPGGLSGDNCTAQAVGRGRTALILSDGMGSGEAAASGSNQAVKLLKQLLTAGFDVSTAVKTVNSMLLINMPGDRFATLDMAVIDTFTGESEFLKVGSAPSFIKRVREVTTINPAAPPAGILQNIEVEPLRRMLSPGDIVVMVSDGIADAVRGSEKESWVANLLRRIGSDRPQDIADRIIKEALDISGGVARDDMAVLVVRVTERPGIVQ